MVSVCGSLLSPLAYWPRIGQIKQKNFDLMKEGEELYFISQEIHKGCILPTERERRHSWRQLTESWICTGWGDLQNSLQIAPVPVCSKWPSSLVGHRCARAQQFCEDKGAASLIDPAEVSCYKHSNCIKLMKVTSLGTSVFSLSTLRMMWEWSKNHLLRQVNVLAVIFFTEHWLETE